MMAKTFSKRLTATACIRLCSSGPQRAVHDWQ